MTNLTNEYMEKVVYYVKKRIDAIEKLKSNNLILTILLPQMKSSNIKIYST